MQDAGRKLAAYLSKRRRQAEQERKRNYIEMYLPHLALGLKEILNLNERQEKQTLANLHKMLEKLILKEAGNSRGSEKNKIILKTGMPPDFENRDGLQDN